jgi:hypothetical protein
MTLKRSKAVVSEKPETKKSDIPVNEIGGDLIARFNKAVADQKSAEAVVNECKPLVVKEGLKHLYETNVANPTNPVSSVKLVDEMGAIVRVTSQNRYSAVDPDMAVNLFEELGTATETEIDPNEYVQEVINPSFDTGVLYSADGTFSDAIFNAYQAAIKKVTTELVAKGKLSPGTESPLVGKRMFMPKPTFGAARWATFPQVELQDRIFSVMKNTVTCTPCATE